MICHGHYPNDMNYFKLKTLGHTVNREEKIIYPFPKNLDHYQIEKI